MADRSLRGMRIGAQSLQSEDGVVFADRAEYAYRCETCGRETVMTFSAEAEVPESWECKHCGASAVLLVDSKPVEPTHDTTWANGLSDWLSAARPHGNPP